MDHMGLEVARRGLDEKATEENTLRQGLAMSRARRRDTRG
jgi:hypothetical protein